MGDNLREALTDTYTEGMPVASSWVDHMMADLVVGDGSIEPELAFAAVGDLHVGRKLADPQRVAAITADVLRTTAGVAALTHGGGGPKSA